MQTTDPETARGIRLQKILAHCGLCSRRKAETLILDGRVTVNGKLVKELGTRADPAKDNICVDGKPVEFNTDEDVHYTYIAVNKPQGVVTTCAQKDAKIILDLVPVKIRVYPVGRLDKDSVGLVLLTDDGELHNRLSHPSHDHEKEYLVFTVQPVSDQDLATMAQGMVIDGKKTRRARVRRVSENGFKIVLKQGLNRQIRKMVGKTGNQVAMLKRTRMANIHLGSLPSGKWRYLTEKEIKQLKQ
ncbi:pseudouridine synthase [uncultured Desulfobacter sp.]|uniref:pseudouridine synthase n=1 Tax=uncultured Desulfobacter sp. TaxID=240139 RepID=UPI002AAA6DDC|nr:pseudouridine synthase [uncultured Desulfobacter sp.]